MKLLVPLLVLALFLPLAAQKPLPPKGSALTQARTRIRTTFRKALSSARSDAHFSGRLARRFVGEAEKRRPPEETWVLLTSALDLAVRGSRVETAIRAASLLGERFQVDALSHELKALGSLARSKDPTVLGQVMDRASELTRSALRGGELGTARKTIRLCARVAQRAREKSWTERARGFQRELTQRLEDQKEYETGLAALERNPGDPAALVLVGSLEIVAGKLEKGLARWAASKSEPEQSIAKGEAAKESDAEACALLAEKWEALAKEQEPRRRPAFQAQAILWLRRALEQLPLGVERHRLLDSLAGHEEALLKLPFSTATERALSPLLRVRRLGIRRPGVAEACDLARRWLISHQTEGGFWAPEAFEKRCLGDVHCSGHGKTWHRVGVSSLALLALMSGGDSPLGGQGADAIWRGMSWLLNQQSANGIYGTTRHHVWPYDHAIATLAVLEAYRLSGSPTLLASATRAVRAIEVMQNPDAGWRYGWADGQSDSSVTSWMVEVLASARDAGITVAPKHFEAASKFLLSLRDGESGRFGYMERGSRSVRTKEMVDDYPPERTEALTACSLSALHRANAPDLEIHLRAAFDTIFHPNSSRQRTPVWAGRWTDFYYWHRGSRLVSAVAPAPLRDRWFKALDAALLEHQRKDENCLRGSWAPYCPWGPDGGRVYSTAINVLALEAPFALP